MLGKCLCPYTDSSPGNPDIFANCPGDFSAIGVISTEVLITTKRNAVAATREGAASETDLELALHNHEAVVV